MFGVQKTKSQGATPGTNSIKPKPKHLVGREQLNHFDEEIFKAHEAIESLEQNVSRLNAITVESEAAQRSLQELISADGGLALAAYSAGKTKPDDSISKIIAHAKSSSEASAGAETALPHTGRLLDNARSQLVVLTDQRNNELNRVVEMLADADARAYETAFNETCRIHDRLVGYSNVASSSIGEIHLILEFPRIARFALPSLGNQDADPFLRHSPSEITVAESARSWTAVKARLAADTNADVDDLLLR